MAACHRLVAQRLDQRTDLQFMFRIAHAESSRNRKRRNPGSLSGDCLAGQRFVNRQQRKTARVMVEKGGDYLLQIKGNQPNLLKLAQGLDALGDTPFLPRPKPATDASKSGTCTPSPSNRSRPVFPTPAP